MIKLYTETDYSPILSIWASSVKATHHFLSKDDFEYYLSNIENYFAQVSIYIYESEGIIKGFLGVSDDNIEMLFADSSYFGQGVGRDLLLYAINYLHISKVDVNEQNIEALEFYIKFGFQQVGSSETDSEGKPYPILHLEL